MTANKRCVMCQRVAQNALNARPEAKASRREYDRQRWEVQRAYMHAKNRRYYEENTDAVNAQKRGYYSANKDKFAAINKEWRANNRGRVRALLAARKKRVVRATPKWADMETIRAVYDEAARLTAETGIVHHVDHIIPLKGKNVCGLHVANNLQPLPWRDNLSKKNRLLPVVSEWSADEPASRHIANDNLYAEGGRTDRIQVGYNPPARGGV